MSFNQDKSVLAGMSTDALNAALASAQAAYLALSTGSQVQTISYGEGTGMKTVTYRASQNGLAGITQLIGLIRAQLGLTSHARRSIPVSF